MKTSTSSDPIVLAIESSCDETAAAVVQGLQVRSSVVASQIDVHAQFGGVVPELASREHATAMVPVVEQAMQKAGLSSHNELDAVAVTEAPGLVGALLIGVQFARGFAAGIGKPLIGVHHMEGHLFSPFLGDDRQEAREFCPHLALAVSGGHTELVRVHELGNYEVLGRTRDDAAGEAYDKVSKMLGLGYPGGPIVDKLAAEGRGDAIEFPRSMLDRPGYEFSFSGLKTAVLKHLETHGEPKSRQELADLCASFQAAVVEILVTKTIRARKESGDRLVHTVGGVAANRGLREAFEAAALQHSFEFHATPLRYCGDNAAMIAAAAAARIQRYREHEPSLSNLPAVDLRSNLGLDDPHLRLDSAAQ